MKTKNILLQIKHKNEIYNLFARTNSANVIVDAQTGETLKERLATIASMVDSNVDNKIQEAINELVNGTGDPEVLDTIKDLVGWINEHQDEYQDLINVTSALETSINEKLEAQKTELEEKISSVKEEIENNIADVKSELEEAIAGIAEDVVDNTNAIEENKQAISDLEDKVAELIPEDGEGALVRRNGTNVWEQIFNVVEELPTDMNEGQLFCVLLEDDPVATIVKPDGEIVQYATIEDALTKAESGETIRLTDDIVIPSGVEVADGVTIVANGKVIVC